MATEFGLSVFSLLLSLSFKRVTCQLYSYLRDRASQDEVESMLEANASLYEILLRAESQQKSKLMTSSSKDIQEAVDESPKVDGEASLRAGGRGVDTVTKQRHNRKTVTMATTAAVPRKRTNQKVVDRRRRRGRRLSSGSSDSEGEGRVQSGESSSESSLSMPSDGESGEDIQVLESLSDSSVSEDERPWPRSPLQRSSNQGSSQAVTDQVDSSPDPTPGSSQLVSVTNGQGIATATTTDSAPAVDSGKPRASPRGKRQIVLAASFNLAPSSSALADPSHAPASDNTNAAGIASNDACLAQAKSVGDSRETVDSSDTGDRLLKEVYRNAVECSCVHTACSILAEDSYLTPIKVFADWLHTYSIVLAATSKQVNRR